MRLALTSDLHGHLPEVPPCDVLLIAGDVCPLESHDLDFQADWLRHRFTRWLRRVPARQTIFIAGNHDFVFDEDPALVADITWPGVYLQDSGCVWEGVRFWGSPWARYLPGWAFTAREEDLRRHWERIPTDTQVLLVHGPPQGLGDEVIGNISGDLLHVGSRTLREALSRLTGLELVVFGHIHECAGFYRLSGLPLVNASLMDAAYEPVNPVHVFDLNF
jgi:Icc-related predicted phosphoesterase